MPLEQYNNRQKMGSEYSGVERTTATIQPMPPQALDNGDKLRLGYLTGVEDDTESLEDRRQMVGLRPATGRRPLWLSATGQKSQAEIELPDYYYDDDEDVDL